MAANTLKLQVKRDGLEVGKLRHDRHFVQQHRVDHAAHAAHGQTTVLNLLQSKLVSHLEPHWVESELTGNRISSEHIRIANLPLVQHQLDHATEQEDLPQRAGGDLVERLRGDGVGIGGVGQVHEFLREHAEEGQHAHAAVLDLGLLQPLDVDEVGQRERVEAGVPDHVGRDVLRLWQEWHGFGHLCHAHGGAHWGGRGGELRTAER